MIISFEKVFKSFNGNYILEDLNFKIEPDDKIGLIGINGAGKTTLLNMLLGECLKDKGEISMSKNLSIGVLKQSNALNSLDTIENEMKKCFIKLDKIKDEMIQIEKQLSSFDNNDNDEYKKTAEKYSNLQSFFENNGGYEKDFKIKSILNGMGFGDKDLQTKISTLSGGEKTRLAIAKLLLQNPQLLILDEPTNHLDFKTLFWLEDYLCNYKGAILVVSHDRFFLDKVTNKTFEIERKNLFAYNGNYSKYLILKKEKYERQLKEYEAQQVKIADLKDFIAKNIVRASTSASAKSRQKELDRMEIIQKPHLPAKSAKFNFLPAYDPVKDLLSIKDLSLSVGAGTNKKHLFDGVNIEIKKDEKVAIIGPNGIGKTSFLKAIQNMIIAEKGIIKWGKNTRIGYYEQEGLTLDSQNTVIDEIWKYAPLKKQLEIRSALGSVLLTGENVFKKVGVLSGGEKAKLTFAILSFKKANVLILDEPTNHL
ncbi:MAG: ABC-F family ATP-binding cassette domain-containing protein, partial [Clostridia bacterium]